MKIKNKKLIAIFICISLLSLFCFAAGKALLSPAMEHIEKNLTMKKCAVSGENVTFTEADFDEVMNSEVKFIKIEELPDSTVGNLFMGSLKLSENQIVERDDFEKIVFRPSSDCVCEAQFVFSNATSGEPEYSAECVINMLDYENQSPLAQNQSVSTMENIAVFKFLGITDPDDDELTFEVISYPSHGTLRITDGSDGHFSYTPVKGYTGEDSFEYVAVDKYGNKSNAAKVSVNVTEKDSDIYFDDLSEHWAHNSAIKTASMGIMTGESDSNGRYLFHPQESVSRGDFLAMALISAGKEPEIKFVTQTSFADDDKIPMNIKSYAEYAKRCGIVTGYEGENGEVYFDSNAAITRAQAAVILERILELDSAGADISVFSDSASVPDWASESIAKLTKCGIFNGTGFGEIKADSYVTRAETAEMMCNVCDYVEE